MAWPWWALAALTSFGIGMVAWAVWGFWQAATRARRATSPSEQAAARLYMVVVGIRLTVVIAVAVMLAWMLLKG